jgi:hypothetical protein
MRVKSPAGFAAGDVFGGSGGADGATPPNTGRGGAAGGGWRCAGDSGGLDGGADPGAGWGASNIGVGGIGGGRSGWPGSDGIGGGRSEDALGAGAGASRCLSRGGAAVSDASRCWSCGGGAGSGFVRASNMRVNSPGSSFLGVASGGGDAAGPGDVIDSGARNTPSLGSCQTG